MAKTMAVWHVKETFNSEIRGRVRSCLELECGNCQGRTIVEKRRWYKRDKTNNGLTRPCPYCFKASYMPDADEHARTKGLEINLEGRR